MKAIVATFVLLTGVGWFTSTVEVPGSTDWAATSFDYGPDSWRRTADGWEDARAWRQLKKPAVDVRDVHPTTVAAFTFFACVGGLVAFCPSLNHAKRSCRFDSAEDREFGDDHLVTR